MDNSNSNRGSEKGKREGCRGKRRAPKGDGSETRRRKIYNFARHSAYKMSQQTTVGAAAAVAARGRGVGGSGASSQAPATADDNQKTDKSCNEADDDEDVHELVSVSVTCHMCVRCGNDLHRGVA